MLEADLFTDMAIFNNQVKTNEQPKPILPQGPLRPNNDSFWQELAHIAHSKPEPNAQKASKPAQSQYSLHTFELNDAMLEDKVKRITA